LLADAGLRPTRQRLSLGELLFGQSGDRHVTAERLYEEALAANLSVSLATVYNALHQFTQAGLLREIAVDGACISTPTPPTTIIFFEDDGELYDIAGANVSVPIFPSRPTVCASHA
jgi:Fur family iron response transcriptional regulator